MKKFIRYLLGLNAASLIRGLRFGFGELLSSPFRALGAVYPFEERKEVADRMVLNTIPQVSLGEILGERKIELSVTMQKAEDGMLPDSDALALLSILVMENPKEVLEIGTFMGHTTRRMAENLKDSTIHTVDLPPDFSPAQMPVGLPPKDDFHLINRRVVGREFRGKECEKRIVQHFGDTAQMDFGKIGRPSSFFIDGSHTYEYCKQDSEKCLALCSGNGVFLWHDCDEWHPGVVRFISEWRRLGRDVVRIRGTCLAYWKAQGLPASG